MALSPPVRLGDARCALGRAGVTGHPDPREGLAGLGWERQRRKACRGVSGGYGGWDN